MSTCAPTCCSARRPPSCRAALRGSRCARGRWSSIPRRAAGPRTPGSSRAERMLSRVADSLYWMSRYFERADNCARVIDATHSLMLNRTVVGTDQRGFRALTCMGMPPDGCDDDPEAAIGRLALDQGNRSSIVACVAAARENASQVREEISSEMWEQLNRLYHEVTRPDVDVMRLVGA